MKALVLRKHGGLDDLDVVDDHPVPQAAEGHVVIRVRASSFNYHDVFTVRGMPGIKVPLPVVIGLDMAGEIAEVGAGVDRLEGRRPRAGQPAQQEEGPDGRDARRRHGGILPRRRRPARRHAGRRELRAGGVAAGRLWHRAPHADHPRHGRRRASACIVLGASGGVGTGCVILAKHLGAEVIACTSSAGEGAPAQGARRRRGDRLSRRPTSRNGRSRNTASRSARSYEGGVDVVINFTGGDTWHPSLRCLKRGGKLLVCGATAGYDPKEDLRYVWSFELQDHRLEQLLRRRPARR